MAQHFLNLMNIQQATRQYETWLARHVRVVKSDLDTKHELMAQDTFSFLRATFYRWMQLFPMLCPKAASAPTVLAVGDLHVENYGTWRDAEGRLVWGINDFDEAFPLPYTIDLVRLATSAWLAIELGHLSLGRANACAAILEGYTKGLEDGGEPIVLAEKRRLLREAITSRLRDPTLFWEIFAALPTIRPVPAKVMLMLKQAMPERGLPFRVAHRRAGLGKPGPGTVHRHCRLARRQNRAGGKIVAAFGLRLGGWLVKPGNLLFADCGKRRPHAGSISDGE